MYKVNKCPILRAFLRQFWHKISAARQVWTLFTPVFQLQEGLSDFNCLPISKGSCFLLSGFNHPLTILLKVILSLCVFEGSLCYRQEGFVILKGFMQSFLASPHSVWAGGHWPFWTFSEIYAMHIFSENSGLSPH